MRSWKLMTMAAALMIALVACRPRGEEQAQDTRPAEPVAGAPATQDPAQDPARDPAAAPADPATASVTGQVEEVGEDRLVVRDQLNERQELQIGDDTRFIGEQGQVISREQIQEGTQVRAAYSGEGDDMRATEVHVLGQGGTGAQGEQQGGGTGAAPGGDQGGAQGGGTGAAPGGDQGGAQGGTR
jgi:hypothetical protein